MPDLPVLPGQLDTFLVQAIGALVEQLYDPDKLQRVQKVVENGVAKGTTIASGAEAAAGPGMLERLRELKNNVEEVGESVLATVLATLVGEIIGVEVPSSALTGGGGGPEDSKVGRSIAAVALKAATGTTGQLEPSDAGATHLLSVLSHIIVHGWFAGIILEKAESYTGWAGPIEEIAKLGEELVESLGLGRMVRVALRPLVQATVATPLEWKVNKAYTPTLLSPASVIRQFLRGKWDWDEVHEELQRQGYSEARINALLNEQRKFASVGDVRLLTYWGVWTNDEALQYLREQGYDEPAALLALKVEGTRQAEQLYTAESSALTAAYVDRRIDDGTFGRLLTAAVPSAAERAFVTELAQLRRDLNTQNLSAAQAAACVKAKVLAVPDYRAALRREGYTEDAVLALELLLRTEIDKETKLEDHRKQADAERAAEKAVRDKAAAEKRAQLAADQARARRGKPSDLDRAVVRGLIPISRYVEVLTPIYDPDTVDILRQAVEADRADYVDQQQRAEDARKRAERQGLNVGQLEQAVLHGILTVDQYRQQLAFLKFAPADADVLTRTLAAKLADQTTAARKRAEAEEAAKRKSVNLTVLEQLVRRGLRSMASYDAFLASLGYDEADRADLEDLLKAKIADDRAATDARAAARDQLGPGGLTIDQFRRSVLLGLRTEAQFDTFLTALGLSADVHGLLMAELRDDLAQTNAARQRRAQGDSRPDARDLPLATVQRAARLGIIAVDTYQQRLVRAGYSDDDIGIETELLLLEIADVQAARRQQAAVDQAAPASGLSLAEIARAVKAGALTLDDYRARAVELGVSQADVDTLTRVLGDDLAETRAAQARRTELDSTLKAQNVSLAVLEDQVRSGALTLDGYFDTLVRAGLAPEDADVLWSLLADELGAPAAAGAAA
jgi:hypothetical protein